MQRLKIIGVGLFYFVAQVKKIVDMLTARLAEIEKIANAWQKKYQIRTPQEQAQQQAASGGGSTGVLA